MDEIFIGENIKNIPWYMTYGNHDCRYLSYHGEYLERLYRNIYMPTGPWNFTLPVGNFSISFTFLSCFINCIGDIQSQVVQGDCESIRAPYNRSKEYEWLEEHLKYIENDKTVLWNLVFTHYPIFSISKFNGDSETLKRNLFPLLRKYKVDVLFSGHNHNMQYLTSHKYKEQQEYKAQDKTDMCFDDEIPCGDDYLFCLEKNTTCELTGHTCFDKKTRAEYGKLPNNIHNITYNKGEELHQVIMGASGANIDNLCLHLQTPMSNTVFGLSDYGFSEVTITDSDLVIKYIHSNTSDVVFQSRIIV